MKQIPEHDVIKVDKDSKRNSKKRYLTTDGICLHCGCIVNYVYENRCLLCCGSEDFLVGEYGMVLRELLELDIEQIKTLCEVRNRSIGSRSRMVFELFKMIFPKLTNIDERIDENLIRKIIIRKRRKFWYVKDIEDAVFKIKRGNNRYNKICLKPVDAKDVIEINGVKV